MKADLLSPVSIQTQSLAFLAVFVYATHATHGMNGNRALVGGERGWLAT